jgi:hypothetical protein
MVPGMVEEPKGFNPVSPAERQIKWISCLILVVTSVASGCLGVVLLSLKGLGEK